MSEYERAVAYIKDFSKSISDNRRLPDGFLTLSENQNGSFSLWIKEPVSGKKTKMILKVQEKGKKGCHYVSITVKSTMITRYGIPSDAECKEDKDDPTISYLNSNNCTQSLEEHIQLIITDYIENYEPSDKFGCCHLYKECSAAKKCLHYDLFYARACWYRKNMESGRIFY